MDEVVYNAFETYFNTLCKTGYISQPNVEKLLVLAFYWDLVRNDYRCHLSKKDYSDIESALYCLFGTTCLIPYPDYLKMGKLKLGEMSEIACRVKALENTNVLKVIHDLASAENKDSHSDIIIMAEEDTTQGSAGTNPNDYQTGGGSISGPDTGHGGQVIDPSIIIRP